METWNKWMEKEFQQKYFQFLEQRLVEADRKFVVYPRKEDRLKAFEITQPRDVKVIIVGTSPYVHPNQAHGLAFSSEYTMTYELTNIFRKIEDELPIVCDKEDGDLTRWAKQGVFLINLFLTIQAGKKHSMKDSGWWKFTCQAIKELYSDDSPKVFLLWGPEPRRSVGWFAKEPNHNHLVILGANPAERDFFYKDYFKPTNDFLIENNKSPIDWR